MAALIHPDSRIQLLDSHTINQIAAGEVVERPASAVKELVENALDASATRIEVRLLEAGRRLISVRDNGIGMNEREITTAILRHATSKIQRLEDLAQTVTLGFRGEALPSIASVSRLTIRSGTEDGLRRSIVIDQGEVGEVKVESGPRGTEVIVEDLFTNTPARLKFLKSDATELGACLDVVQRLAIAYPEVRFSVHHDRHELLNTAGDGDLVNAISGVWGSDTARILAEIDHYENGVRVQGLISPPHVTKSNRNMQWMVVNRRPVRSRALHVAIDLAYKMLTPERRFPIALLVVSVDPAQLDTNVSPTKTEVKFQKENLVFDAVRHGIKQALLYHGMVPSADDLIERRHALAEATAAPFAGPGEHGLLNEAWVQKSIAAQMPLHSNAPGAQSAFTSSLPSHAAASNSLEFHSTGFQTSLSTSQHAAEPDPTRSYDRLLNGLKVIGQAMNTFIIAENEEGILLIDQHVAHERILYEQLSRERGGDGIVPRQPLLTPETVHAGHIGAMAVRDRQDELAKIGYELEGFGGESFLVRTVPAISFRRSAMAILRDIVAQMATGESTGCLIPSQEDLFILCACKMAVKAGDPLAIPEMEKLLFDLALTENPYLCPHGRPITSVIEKQSLLRKFKRC